MRMKLVSIISIGMAMALTGCELLPPQQKPLEPLVPGSVPASTEPAVSVPAGPVPGEEGEGESVLSAGSAGEKGPEAGEAPAMIEGWQAEVQQHYLEAWAYLFQEVTADPARVEVYFQDVTWPGDDRWHQRNVVEGMRIAVTNLAGVEWKDVREVARREITVGPLHPDGRRVKVVDYVPESLIHLTNGQTGEVKGDMTVPPHVNYALLVYDEGDRRWKIGGFQQMVLPQDPEEAEEEYRAILEEAHSWQG